jgi:hypothetical protein
MREIWRIETNGWNANACRITPKATIFPVIFLGNRKSKLVGQFDTQIIVNEPVEIFG